MSTTQHTAADSGQRCRQHVSPTTCSTAAAAARPYRGQQAAGSTGAASSDARFRANGGDVGQHLPEPQDRGSSAGPERTLAGDADEAPFRACASGEDVAVLRTCAQAARALAARLDEAADGDLPLAELVALAAMAGELPALIRNVDRRSREAWIAATDTASGAEPAIPKACIAIGDVAAAQDGSEALRVRSAAPRRPARRRRQPMEPSKPEPLCPGRGWDNTFHDCYVPLRPEDDR